MTDTEINAIKNYVNAAIAAAIVNAFGREGLNESIALSEAERALDLILPEVGN